jgi:hypothetical protein
LAKTLLVEISQGAPPTGARTRLVAFDRVEPIDEAGRGGVHGHERAAFVTAAHHRTIRRRDRFGVRLSRGACILSGDGGGERRDRRRGFPIAPNRHRQAVLAGILRRTRLAGARFRPRALLRVAAVGGQPCRGDHAAASTFCGSADPPSMAAVTCLILRVRFSRRSAE